MWISTIVIFLVIFAIFAVFVVKDILVARKKRMRYKWKDCLASYLMLAPAIALAFIFVLLPILYSLGYAFTDFYLLKPDDIDFNGLKNFVDIFKSIFSKGDMYHAIINTGKFVIGVVPLQIGLALGLALFVNNGRKFTGIFKVCYFAPVVISLTVTSYLWLQILSPSETGLLNMFLGIFNVAPKDFLRNKDTAMLWIILLSAWQGCGYQMLIFLSGLTFQSRVLSYKHNLEVASVTTG